MFPIKQADDKEKGSREKYCPLTEPLAVLNTDHLLPLDLGGESIDAPQFRVIHDLLTSPHETNIPLPEGSQ
jgi:hypothetical protein